ncbi:MAG: mobile mystery protein A [Burkholderiaceae bacterium]
MYPSRLMLDQMDRILREAAATPLPAPPRGGWLKAVRTALGVSTRQLAARLGVTHSAVVQSEAAEASGAISMRQLRQLADALGCDLRYVLVPRTPLAAQVDARAEGKARERVASLAHSMALEAQRPDGDFLERQVAEAKDELLRGRRSRLWD